MTERGIPNFRAQTAEECEKIEVGDRVRSYDFEAHDDCYIEGIVEAIGEIVEGCPRYRVRGELRLFGGKESEVGGGIEPGDNLCFPPVNGTRNLLGGYTNGVRKVQA